MTIVDTYRMVAAYRLNGNGQGRLANLAVARTIAVPDGAVVAYFQAETQNVRLRFDGVDPAAGGTGFVVVAGGDPVGYPVSQDMDIRAIEETATAVLQYLFLGK